MKNESLKYPEINQFQVSRSDEFQPQLDFKSNSIESGTINQKLKVLSLFSGCGGMDIGFEGGFDVHEDCINQNITPNVIKDRLANGFVKLKTTNFKTVFANDIVSEAKFAWINYFKNRYGEDIGPYYTESIVDLVKVHKNGNKVFPENIDIVTGGFPCQDFSVAGKRQGLKSTKNHLNSEDLSGVPTVENRGSLYIWMKKVIEITKPKMFIAENVKGLTNLSNVKNIIQKDFSSIGDNGYIVLEPQILHAADYGIPQSRERVFFIGIKKSALNKKILKKLSQNNFSRALSPYPYPTHGFTLKEDSLKQPVKLKSILKHIPEPENSFDLTHKFYSKAKFMGKHCQGQKEIDLEGISPTIRAEHHGNIEFRRLSKDKGGKQIKELTKGLKERRLTPRECALIQTFPSDYEFVMYKKNTNKYLISPSRAYKLIGNAVPPLLAYHIAKRIEGLWSTYFK